METNEQTNAPEVTQETETEVDGTCYQMRDSEGITMIFKGGEYFLGDDGIYIPYSE